MILTNGRRPLRAFTDLVAIWLGAVELFCSRLDRLDFMREARRLIDRFVLLGGGMDQDRLTSDHGAPVYKTSLRVPVKGVFATFEFVDSLFRLRFLGWRACRAKRTRLSGTVGIKVFLMFSLASKGSPHIIVRFRAAPVPLAAVVNQSVDFSGNRKSAAGIARFREGPHELETSR